MIDNIDMAFKEKVNIFYYAHMRRVAQDLFDQGYKTPTVESSLAITKGKAQHFRDLYDKRELLKADVERNINIPQPFAYISDGYRWEDFTQEVKNVAKVFFEMQLHVRAIASYLRVPLQTVYSWHILYKKNQFQNPSKKGPPLKLTTDKFTIINGRKYYSYEIRQIAKDCFEKGMKAVEVARYLDIPVDTVYPWRKLFNEGRFYINEEEKLSFRKPFERMVTVPTSITQDKLEIEFVPHGRRYFYNEAARRAAMACFEKGMGYKTTARELGIPQAAIRQWNRLYKEGRFTIKNGYSSIKSKDLTA